MVSIRKRRVCLSNNLLVKDSIGKLGSQLHPNMEPEAMVELALERWWMGKIESEALSGKRNRKGKDPNNCLFHWN